MTTEQRDQELRQHFSLLKREEQSRIPSYQSTRSRRVVRPIATWPRLALAAAAVLIALIGLRVGFRSDSPTLDLDRQMILSINSIRSINWESRTDFLLATPRSNYLQAVPSVYDRKTSWSHLQPAMKRLFPDPQSLMGRNSL